MARVTYRIDINEDRLERQTGVIIRRKERQLSRRIATDARAAAPVKKPRPHERGYLPGGLKRSIGVLPQFYSPFHVSGGVEATADYAAAVHEGRHGLGRRIHVKHAKAMRFWWHGAMWFRQSVRMSDISANPFLRRAATAAVVSDPDIEMSHVDLD